jgi:hypothetical protein
MKLILLLQLRSFELRYRHWWIFEKSYNHRSQELGFTPEKFKKVPKELPSSYRVWSTAAWFNYVLKDYVSCSTLNRQKESLISWYLEVPFPCQCMIFSWARLVIILIGAISFLHRKLRWEISRMDYWFNLYIYPVKVLGVQKGDEE